jgi:phosphohistidine phosphatase
MALGRLFAGKAEALGPALRSVPRPTVALVSPAARTRATAELDDDLYGAEPEEVMAHLQALEDDVDAAMVVGHNPTAHSLSQGLIAPRDKKGMSLAVRTGFPTCALGVYAFKVANWSDVEAGTAKLVALLAPPYAG